MGSWLLSIFNITWPKNLCYHLEKERLFFFSNVKMGEEKRWGKSHKMCLSFKSDVIHFLTFYRQLHTLDIPTNWSIILCASAVLLLCCLWILKWGSVKSKISFHRYHFFFLFKIRNAAALWRDVHYCFLSFLRTYHHSLIYSLKESIMGFLWDWTKDLIEFNTVFTIQLFDQKSSVGVSYMLDAWQIDIDRLLSFINISGVSEPENHRKNLKCRAVCIFRVQTTHLVQG